MGSGEVSMLQEIYKSIILFSVSLVLIRLMGKRTIAQLSPFDMIVIIIMGASIAIPLEDDKLHLSHGITPVLIISILNYLLSVAIASNRKVENLFQGSSTVMVRNGKAILKNMKRERVTMADLLMLLRDKGVTNIEEVLEATLEPTGKLSVIKKKMHQPITGYDLGIPLGDSNMPTVVIDQGKVMQTDLDKAQVGLDLILKELSKKGIKDLKEIKTAWLDENGELSVDLFKKQNL